MIKTFPVRFDEHYHRELKAVAHYTEKSMHQYILDAVRKSIVADIKAMAKGGK